MKFKFATKTQISIFILVAIMIIFLFIFLINNNSSNNSKKIEENKNTVLEDSNSKLLNLKDSVDYCFEKQLRKAVIIAGTRGGFIYDNGEYYFSGVLAIKLSAEFLSPFPL